MLQDKFGKKASKETWKLLREREKDPRNFNMKDQQIISEIEAERYRRHEEEFNHGTFIIVLVICTIVLGAVVLNQ